LSWKSKNKMTIERIHCHLFSKDLVAKSHNSDDR
jgi:hypothetical protein